MANQPKKYTKFVATAATATLVASAIVPVASAATPSFPDIAGNDHAAAIEALYAAGLIGGKADGTFAPSENVTRGQVVQMLGKWAEKQGLEVPADYKTVQRFKDVPLTADENLLKYAALAKDNGIFTGSNDNLNGADKISREHMAVVLNSAYAAITGTSLVEVAGDVSDVTVGDLDKVNANYRSQVLALKKLGVTAPANFNPTGKVTRGHFASFLNATIKVEAPSTEVAVESVSAINAKSLKVTFNTAADVTAADFSVAKGTVKSNVANVVIADDKKSATIELTSKLTKGDYTVTVKQGNNTPLTGTVTVEDEKVAGLEILSDVAPVVNTDADAAFEEATVGYQVTNQYGEDLTKLFGTSLVKTVSGAASDATLNADGSIRFTLVANAKVGDTINITLVNAATGVSTTKTIKLSDQSAASTATVGTLYNKDGKTLSQDTDVSKDKFYLPITVKDQYGKEITSAARANSELIVTNTNPAVATFANTNEIKEVTIDGKDVLALEVSGVSLAGTASVLVIAKANGSNAQGSVTVKEGVKIATVSLSAPTELVTANKDVYFPLTVTDTNGIEVKTLKALDAINDTLTPSTGEIVEVEGKEGLFVKVTDGSDAGEVEVTENAPLTVVVTSQSGKVSTQTVTPKAEAVASVITGIDADLANALRAGDTTGVTVKNTDLVVEDQFGQVITDKAVLETLTFELSAPDAATFTTTNGAAADAYKQWTIKPVSGATKTSEKLTFKLRKDSSAVEASAFTKTYSIVKDADFASYTVKDVPTIYAADNGSGAYLVEAAYNEDIKVNATTKDGKVVELTEGTDFVVTGQPADGAEVKFADKATTATKTVTITINATGEELTKELTYSNVAPKVAKVQLVKNNTVVSTEVATLGEPIEITSSTKIEEVKNVNFDGGKVFDLSELAALVDFVITDTYGKKVAVDESDLDDLVLTLADGEDDIAQTLTLAKVSGTVTFANNGAANAEVSEFTAGSEFNSTVKFGGVTGNAVKVIADAKHTPTADAAAALATAKTNLTNAIAAANTNLGTGTVTADGLGAGNVTAAEKTAYTDAIAAATAVKNNAASTTAQLNTATTDLGTATTTFNTAKQ
ncbi:S-layer homology domain-containing protein [Ureibacillus chungkukjangi]|uniref:S-layer family protein n=1 Tax=Ureibacillus chungkukjangi TaxID=1202712 RepID=A0A318TRU4_9BACL|nr:S-layer homology domain-containing protein [Ureibacillus chungkukjangi]PYF07566.1 S-layer family protein [Ureibacillus chungkukjangi]